MYALVSGQLILYVGQTGNMANRERQHRQKQPTCTSKHIPDYIEWDMKLLEKCEDALAVSRERHFYDTLKPLYNKCVPGRSSSELERTEARKEKNRLWREANRERVRETLRLWKTANRERVNEQSRNLYAAKKNCPPLVQF